MKKKKPKINESVAFVMESEIKFIYNWSMCGCCLMKIILYFYTNFTLNSGCYTVFWPICCYSALNKQIVNIYERFCIRMMIASKLANTYTQSTATTITPFTPTHIKTTNEFIQIIMSRSLEVSFNWFRINVFVFKKNLKKTLNLL